MKTTLLTLISLLPLVASSQVSMKLGAGISKQVTTTDAALIAYTEPTADILWWQMDEGSGSTFTATVGPNGSTSGGNGYVTGANGAATSAFNFGGDTTSFSDSSVTYGNNVITVTFWAYSTAWSTGTPTILSSKSDTTTANTWRIENDEGILYYIMQGTTVPNIKRVSLAAPSNNAWHHFAVVLDASTSSGSITLYVDGALASPSSVDDSKDGASSFAANVLRVGNLNGASFWGGYMDDVRIYASALNAGQILKIYQNPQ
jgi:predicted secreted protein